MSSDRACRENVFRGSACMGTCLWDLCVMIDSVLLCEAQSTTQLASYIASMPMLWDLGACLAHQKTYDDQLAISPDLCQ